MHRALRAPPWTTLWRLLVTTLLFGFLSLLGIGVVTDLDESTNWPTIQLWMFVLAYVVAAIVVWSEDIPWPGDA